MNHNRSSAPFPLIIVMLICMAAADVLSAESGISFEDDVLPVLTRQGCNSGGCHGKVAGQNGFRLSLRGYSAEEDYDWLMNERRGRRINLGAAEASLLLLKATGESPHEGGARFARDSESYRTLTAWIRQGAPGPDQAPLPEHVSLSPESRHMQPGETAKVVATAHYADGRVRDVTWLTNYYSNDSSTVTIDEQGEVTAVRAGEATVRGHFRGLVAVATFTIPHAVDIDPSLYVGGNGFIDRAVFAKLEALRIPPSPDCGDTEFLRRAYLDATGRLPDAATTQAFLADASSGKRDALIGKLTESDAFTDYWTLQMADLLQNRKERDHDVRGSKGVRAFHHWLREQIAENRPWDAIAREVLLAKGSVADAPEVGYFVTTLGEKRRAEESEVPDAVAQAFLGTRIGCARCHNHPLEKYTQDDFYRFAAFFARTSLERVQPRDGDTELVVATEDEARLLRDLDKTRTELGSAEDEKKAGELTQRVADLEKQLTERRDNPPTARQPRTNQSLVAAPLDRQLLQFASGEDPREQLVDWLTGPAREVFAGAMVNRVWRHFLGVGMVEPVDDLRDSNPPSNRALWDSLTAAFIESGYDMRALVRVIMQSRTYQLSATTLDGNTTDAKFYSHYYARRLPAEVLLDAMCDITGVPEFYDGYPVGMRAVQVPDPSVKSHFLELFGRSERVTACACERSGDVTLPQLLHLYNGGVREKIDNGESTLHHWIGESMADSDIVDRLYLEALCRLPNDTERARITAYLQSAPERNAALADVFWAVINTKEFSFNH
ncbi:MAG: DUF1553 domain-containing protein [Verrucomicrobiales bacterium]